MQVDPIKPKLKPPGTQRLKLKCVRLLSTFAFKLNLRRYSQATQVGGAGELAVMSEDTAGMVQAGAYTRPLFTST